MAQPTRFMRETKDYWVLAEYAPSQPPKNKPDQKWEVRTSKNDGRTYCSCPAWVTALNKHRRLGSTGEVRCKHLERFRAECPAQVIEVHTVETFRRGALIIRKDVSVTDHLQVRRGPLLAIILLVITSPASACGVVADGQLHHHLELLPAIGAVLVQLWWLARRYFCKGR